MFRMMKITLILVSLLFAATANADQFIGFKLAQLDIEKGAAKDPLNIAVNYGYALDTWLADLSLIAEVNHSVEKGRTSQGEDLEFNANAAYLLWKTTHSMYISMRAGIVQNETITAGNSIYKTGLLLGVSIGQVIGRTRLQIEYTSLAGEAKFFGIGLEFDL